MGGHLLTYRPAISLEIWAKTELQKQNKEMMPIIAQVQLLAKLNKYTNTESAKPFHSYSQHGKT